MTTSTIAPSEKHLEDYVLSDLQKLHDTPPEGVDVAGAKLLRQFVLPSGIVDILVIGTSTIRPINVLELKKGPINAKAVVQILRYLRDLKEIRGLALDIVRHPNDAESRRHDPKLSGLLIGHSIDVDEGLLIAAELVDVDVMTYQYNPETNTYGFKSHKPKRIDRETKYLYARGQIGLAFQRAWAKRMEIVLSGDTNPTQEDIDESFENYWIIKDKGIQTFYEYVEETEGVES